MPHHQRWLPGSSRLPAAVGQDLTAGFDFEQTLFIAAVIAQAKSPGPEICSQRLGIALFKEAIRNERFVFEFVGYCRE